MADYVKNIGKLFSGNILAQLIVLLGAPLLILFYSPEDLGRIGIAVSFISIFSILMVLRLDAFLLTVKESQLFSAVFVVLKVVAFQFLLVSILFYFASNYFEYLINLNLSLFESLVILIGSLFVASTYILNTFFSRFFEFGVIVKSVMLKAVLLVGIQLGFGGGGITKGLWFADFFSRLIQFLTLLTFFRRRKNVKEIYPEAHFIEKAKPFMIFSTFASLVSTSAAYLPVLILPSILSLTLSGLYFFAIQLILTPISMFSQSISKVFSSEFVKLPKKEGKKIFYQTSFFLFLLSGVGVGLVLLILPLIESFIPIKWKRLNEIFDILIILAIPILSVSSVSQIFNIIGKQKYLIYSEFIKLVLISLCFTFIYLDPFNLNFSFRDIVILIVCSSTVGYVIQFVFMALLLSKYNVDDEVKAFNSIGLTK